MSANPPRTGLARTRRTAELVPDGRVVSLEEIGALSEIEASSIERFSADRIDAEFTDGLQFAASRPWN